MELSERASRTSDSTANLRVSNRPDIQLVSAAAVQIVREASREGASIAELSRLALTDPAFAVRVLSLVNSPALGRNRSISDVSQAAALLGVRGLQTVGLSLVLTDLIPMGPDGELLLVQSLRRGLAARLLASELAVTDPDSHFTTGLLLEVGMLEHAAASRDTAFDIARLPAEHRVLYEQVRGLLPHPQSGADLCRRLMLSEACIESIAHHHDPEPPKGAAARIAWLSERIAGVFESGAIAPAREALARHAAAVGVGPDRVEFILDQLPSLVAAAASAFDRSIPRQPDLNQLRDDANARLVQMNRDYEETVATLRRVLTEREQLSKQLADANRALADANRALSELAITDPLTQLPNRRALQEALDRDLARSARDQLPISFAVLDIDHFKKFNDRHGHLAGDEVLRGVARVLMAAVRKGDLVARFGGEEFCVVLPQADEVGAMLVARRFRMAIERCVVNHQGTSLQVTVSIGIATVPAKGPRETTLQLFERADRALYQAKAQGRNCVVAAEPIR